MDKFHVFNYLKCTIFDLEATFTSVLTSIVSSTSVISQMKHFSQRRFLDLWVYTSSLDLEKTSAVRERRPAAKTLSAGTWRVSMRKHIEIKQPRIQLLLSHFYKSEIFLVIFTSRKYFSKEKLKFIPNNRVEHFFSSVATVDAREREHLYAFTSTFLSSIRCLEVGWLPEI